jgi:pimeloyl-ACP methyl ester carboxylesterase
LQHRTIDAADGTRLSFHWRAGSAERVPLLVVPGLGMPAETWFAVLNRVDPARPVAAIDPRGSGRSGGLDGTVGATSGDWCTNIGGSIFADDAIRVLDDLGWGRVHVAGISMGGMIAQHLAVLHPSRVLSLALVCTYGRPGPWTKLVWKLRQALAEHSQPAEQRMAAALFLTGPTAVDNDPAIIDKLMDLWEASPPNAAGYRAQMRFCAGHDLLDELAPFGPAALVVSGADDLLCPPRCGEELAVALGGRFVCVPGATHLLTLEQPATVANLLDAHLGTVEAMAIRSTDA